jgi:hypothetical protein
MFREHKEEKGEILFSEKKFQASGRVLHTNSQSQEGDPRNEHYMHWKKTDILPFFLHYDPLALVFQFPVMYGIEY